MVASSMIAASVARLRTEDFGWCGRRRTGGAPPVVSRCGARAL